MESHCEYYLCLNTINSAICSLCLLYEGLPTELQLRPTKPQYTGMQSSNPPMLNQFDHVFLSFVSACAGDVSPINMSPVSQSQFIPLGEILCLAVSSMNSAHKPVTREALEEHLTSSFPGIVTLWYLSPPGPSHPLVPLTPWYLDVVAWSCGAFRIIVHHPHKLLL